MNIIEDSNIPGFVEFNKILLHDSYSLNLLAPLIYDYPYLAFSASSLRPYSLNYILNDIIINDRKEIIEFGSGISTIMLGRLIKKNELKTSVVSIDHDRHWIDVIAEHIRKEKLINIKLIHAPLVKCNLALSENEWYDIEEIKSVLATRKFDVVIIDGPPAWEDARQLARYPAVPFVLDYLSDNSAIYLDDANRVGEQAILKRWSEKYNMSFGVTSGTLAFTHRGKAFHPAPSRW